jgi:G3E family GTPase
MDDGVWTPNVHVELDRPVVESHRTNHAHRLIQRGERRLQIDLTNGPAASMTSIEIGHLTASNADLSQCRARRVDDRSRTRRVRRRRWPWPHARRKPPIRLAARIHLQRDAWMLQNKLAHDDLVVQQRRQFDADVDVIGGNKRRRPSSGHIGQHVIRRVQPENRPIADPDIAIDGEIASGGVFHRALHFTANIETIHKVSQATGRQERHRDNRPQNDQNPMPPGAHGLSPRLAVTLAAGVRARNSYLSAMTAPVPVTVFTGFLGAGKTTLLNRILSEPHGKKYAVIVNEFGEIGIDNDLIVDADEEVFEMNNGCVCCTVRGDLIRIIEGLMKRQSAITGAKGGFDAILVETTGLAKPAPVAQTFFVDADVRAKTKLDAIVTVVDAKHVGQQLDTSEEAVEQIAFADVILLNKTDLVSPGELAAIERRIRAVNPTARLHRMVRGDIPLDSILNIGAFDLDRVTEIDPHFLPDHDCDDSCAHHDHDHGHHHHDHDHVAASGIASVSLSTEKLIDAKKLLPWLNALTQARGPDILRLKGIFAFPDEPKRFVVQGVHMIVEGDTQRDWKPDEKRVSRLVFIGRNLDHDELEQSFLACAA